jgi:hypothetical protein
MKARSAILLVALCGLLGACAPASQSQILTDTMPAIGKVHDFCRDNSDTHVAKATCWSNNATPILREADFKDMDLLYAFEHKAVAIAMALDDKKISNDEASKEMTAASNAFFAGVRRRDAERTQRFVAGMAAISSGLNQAPQYTPAPMPSYAPVSQPSMPPMTPVDNTLGDNYLREMQQKKSIDDMTPAERLTYGHL